MSELLPNFTHLHVHSHYTFLGAIPSVEDLAARAAEEGFSHLALTDSHALYGAIAFARACARHAIQPIIGMAVQMQPLVSTQTRHSTTNGARPGAAREVGADWIVLLAENAQGYRSLCRLSSALQGAADREQRLALGLDWETLRANREGLTCVVGGRRSRVYAALHRGDGAAASRYLAQMAGLFDQRTFLALELHTQADVEIAQEMVGLGARLGLGSVAVQPVYSLAEDEREQFRLLAAIDRNCAIDSVSPDTLPHLGQPQVDVHWLSSGAMVRRFELFPQALSHVGEVLAPLEPALPDGRPIWPVLELRGDPTPQAALRTWAESGMRKRYPLAPTGGFAPSIQQRFDAELGMIERQGFAPFFLMVADVVAFARRKRIPVSTRGSVANSLIAYCLGITTVDPLAHNLLFERFLNPSRSGLPDIDLDFCSARRDEVLHYVRAKYGPERVALLATVNTMRPKSALRETAKAYGVDEAMIRRLIKQLTDRNHPDPRRRVVGTVAAMLAELSSPLERRIVEDAFKLVGRPHYLSIHPGGVAVTPGPSTDYFPVQWTPKGFLVSQFAHDDMEALGLPKMDLLGIRALTVLADTAELVRAYEDPTFGLESIPLEDAQTARLIATGDTVGVFQCDSNGARRTLRQLQARNVHDLAVANAFFKPGPATGGMAAGFIRRYRGQEAVSYLHPALAPILASTQGVLLFQEQILRVAVEIAGLSWGEADNLRRGMSKFAQDAMEEMATRFIEGCLRPGPTGPELSRPQAEQLWGQVLAFAGYGFNQGHATAYADVSYRSAYLKAHYPAPFFAARLANYGGFHHPAIYMAEAIRWGIRVRPPHINYSDQRFTLRYFARRPNQTDKSGPEQNGSRSDNNEGQANGRVPVLWMGLGQVHSLRQAAVQAILQARTGGPFESLSDLCRRVPLQKKELRHLIQCGALDGLGQNRATLLAQSEDEKFLARLERRREQETAPQLAFDFGTEIDAPAAGVEPEVTESPGTRLDWEKSILGWPVSVTPLETVAGALDGLHTLAHAAAHKGDRVAVGAYRLPGWTGGAGCFVGDGRTFCTAILPKALSSLRQWQPVCLTGRWAEDEWGSPWFQVETVRRL